MASMDFARTPPNIGAVIPGGGIGGKKALPVTSLSFHEDGMHLFVASGEDCKLRLVDCQKGSCDQPAIKCERDGVRLVEATHHNYSVLVAGEGKDKLPKQELHVTYLSLYDNKVLRKFRGHTAPISDVSMSPVDDHFLSSSSDGTVRLWNVQQPACLATLDLPSSLENRNPHAVFDSTGLVFGVTASMPASGGNLIHLYDARKYSGGSFAEFQLDRQTLQKAMLDKGLSTAVANDLSKSHFSSLRFNTSGNQMLVTAKKGLAVMLDGFNGSVTQVFVSEGGGKNHEGNSDDLGMAACFTPDDRFVLGGCDDGTIRCWNASSGNLLNKLEGHTGRVGCIEANPKFAMFASACTSTALWIW